MFLHTLYGSKIQDESDDEPEFDVNKEGTVEEDDFVLEADKSDEEVISNPEVSHFVGL